MLNGFSYGKIHRGAPVSHCLLIVITQETAQSLAALKRPVSPTLRDGQCQGRGIFGRMVDRISANLAWNKIVRPQYVGYGRISVDDLEAHTATFLEPMAHRFKKGSRVRLEIVNGDSAITDVLWTHYFIPSKIGTDTIYHSAEYPWA